MSASTRVPRPPLSRRSLLKAALSTAALATLTGPALAGCDVAPAPSTTPSASTGSGPTPLPDVVADAEQAALVALAMARSAAAAQTFAVGGAIVENATGRVVFALQNRVMRTLGSDLGTLSGTAYTADPTAHGERQLTYWYFANRAALALPDPSELTIVTSLDPCAMCAGSLTAAGFHTGVVALDDFAGVNYDSRTEFPGYPSSIRDALLDTFGYYAIDGGRTFAGASDTLFAATAVGQDTADGCTSVFTDSVEAVRAASSGSGLDPSDPANRMTDPARSSIRGPVTLAFPDAFTIRLADYRRPDRDLKGYLAGLVRRTPKARNAVAFVDYYGNLLMASADRFDINPLATAFMTATQMYARMRFQLVNDPITSPAAQQSLSGPRYGTFVFLHAPDGVTPLGLKDLGAYGSSMEGPIPVTAPSNLQYYEDPLAGTVDDLETTIAAMPPFYRELVAISPQRVAGG